jgi:hypothetical protein
LKRETQGRRRKPRRQLMAPVRKLKRAAKVTMAPHLTSRKPPALDAPALSGAWRTNCA